MMLFPDKPGLTLAPQGLNAIRGEWLAQPKPDGWRCLVLIGHDDVRYISRAHKPLPVSQELREQWDAELIATFGADTLLDAEWLQRRPSARTERLWVFDLLAATGYTTRQMSAIERWEMLERTLGPGHGLLLPTVLTATQVERETFWNDIRPGGPRHDPAYEGMVLKDVESRYIGSVRACAANPRWIRVKWRGGADGQTELEDAK